MEMNHGRSFDLFRVRLVMVQHINMYTFVLLHSLAFTSTTMESISLIVLILVNSLSLMKACLMDPGRVNTKIQHKYQPDEVSFGDDISVQILVDKNGDWLRRIRIKDVNYEERYCLQCNLFRIDRMVHCRECDTCVMDMDHHCVWFGNCIGRNNIRHFHMYLYTLVVVILINILFMYKVLFMDSDVLVAIRLLIFIVMVFYTVFFCVMLFFTIFNIYIALCSSRSRDFLKGQMRSGIDIKRACINFSRIKPDISFNESCDQV